LVYDVGLEELVDQLAHPDLEVEPAQLAFFFIKLLYVLKG
jgi:hypothetical protein